MLALYFSGAIIRPMSSLLTSKEAAEKLGVTVARVRQLVLAGSLPAQKFGRDLAINEDDLKLVAVRKPGRPRKAGILGAKAELSRANAKKGRAK
jgi:excisionase family DNA binding protein